MPLILPGNVASATAPTTYNVANSCRFNDGDAPKMTLTPGSNGSDVKFTFSCWVKRGTNFGAQQYIMLQGSGSTLTHIKFDGNDKLDVQGYESGTAFYNLSNRKFRDPGAWYNIIVAIDTTQGTAANRVKIYVNGTEETSWDTETVPAEDKVLAINNTSYDIVIGAETSANYFDGYLAEVVYIDGTQYANTDFGEFDSDSPTIWKPKDPSGLTFGTNGFYLDFEASDNLGNDANGGTDLTEVNFAATDSSTDTPTNNFATLNPLYKGSLGATTFAEGNLKFHETNSPSESSPGASTIAVANGKWYFEVYCEEDEDHPPWIAASTVESAQTILTAAGTGHIWGLLASTHAVALYNDVVYKTSGGSYSEILTAGLTGGRAADGDIMKIALDLDNGKVWFGKNNEWSNGSASISATLDASNNDTTVTAGTDHYLGCGGEGQICWANFGSPARTISSSNADANGYGNFEYAVPSGFFALCTKNLAEYG